MSRERRKRKKEEVVEEEKKEEKEEESTKCSICYRYKTVASSNGCEHSFCIECCAQIARNECPTCRHRGSFKRVRAIEHLVKSLNVKNSVESELALRLSAFSADFRREVCELNFRKATYEDAIEFLVAIDRLGDERDSLDKAVEAYSKTSDVVLSMAAGPEFEISGQSTSTHVCLLDSRLNLTSVPMSLIIVKGESWKWILFKKRTHGKLLTEFENTHSFQVVINKQYCGKCENECRCT